MGIDGQGLVVLVGAVRRILFLVFSSSNGFGLMDWMTYMVTYCKGGSFGHPLGPIGPSTNKNKTNSKILRIVGVAWIRSCFSSPLVTGTPPTKQNLQASGLLP